MVTRDARLSDFNQLPPDEGTAAHLLCEDHCGTYMLPFVCSWSGGRWLSSASGTPIQATVVGWKPTLAPD
jgi:hypothetical protein